MDISSVLLPGRLLETTVRVGGAAARDKPVPARYRSVASTYGSPEPPRTPFRSRELAATMSSLHIT
ncbi:hypothetical protein OG863_06865 [Streptomyces decoyicus]|uniref:Uncharacterized protein n=1 Tax=Streptomyces decoyicus TaxID=249567 RepID=A0ABZ1FC25_9ACTN|nr:hypothetical protein [Streptomyces decoyicus]WSB67706.1 hypothetical protein OG863_06865 [Streptomyces decoyicus]